MSYNYTVTLTVPKSFADIAAKIGMALDNDSGGRCVHLVD